MCGKHYDAIKKPGISRFFLSCYFGHKCVMGRAFLGWDQEFAPGKVRPDFRMV